MRFLRVNILSKYSLSVSFYQKQAWIFAYDNSSFALKNTIQNTVLSLLSRLKV